MRAYCLSFCMERSKVKKEEEERKSYALKFKISFFFFFSFDKKFLISFINYQLCQFSPYNF